MATDEKKPDWDTLLTAEEIAKIEKDLLRLYQQNAEIFNTLTEYTIEKGAEAQADLSPEDKKALEVEAKYLLHKRFSSGETPEQQDLALYLFELILKLYPEAMEKAGFSALADILDLLAQSKKALQSQPADDTPILPGLELDETEQAENKKLDLMPSSPAIRRIMEAITSHAKSRTIKMTKTGKRLNNRSQSLEYMPLDDGSYTIKQQDKYTTTEINIDIPTLKGNEKGKGKGVKKCYSYLLSQCNKQNFSPIIRFSLNDLVARGMYSNVSNARTGLKNALDVLQKIKVSGVISKGKRKIEQAESGVLFYHYKISKGYVEVSVNDQINIEFFAAYFAAFPVFAYKLKTDNAFNLAYYIFTLARQRTQEIKEKGYFTLSFRSLQEWLQLPTAEEYEPNEPEAEKKKFKPKQYVIDPIKKAIEEINTEAKKDGSKAITITPVEPKNAKGLVEWLDKGYIKITIAGDLREQLTELAERREEKIAQLEEYRKKRIEAKRQSIESNSNPETEDKDQ